MAYDPWSDRNYLIGLLQRSNPRDPLRQTAEKQWELLNQRESQQAQLGATRENLAETARSREAAQTQAAAERGERAKETAGYRQDVLSQREEAAKGAEAARVLGALQYETDPNVTKQVLAQFYAGHGIAPPTAKPDAAGEAARRARAASGQPVAPTPAQPEASGVSERPLTPEQKRQEEVVGGRTPPTTTIAPSSFIDPATGLSTITGHRPGNFATPGGEVRPPGTVGYINGQPAGDVIAAGALKTGVTPQSESGRTALASRLSREGLPFFSKTTEPTGVPPAAAPTAGAIPPTPSLNERLGGAGEALSKFTDPLGTVVRAAGAGIGNLFSGGGANQIVQGGGGPTPEPTPGGPTPTGPFSGSIGEITQGPLPTPAGTPPAIPTPPPVISEEEKRRSTAQTRP
jgi:hypothetical protein